MTILRTSDRSKAGKLRASRSVLIASLFCAGLVSNGTAIGQEPTIEEIIVTAPDYVPTESETGTKSDIPLIEMPQSISVVTRDQIDLLNFIDVQQAVRYVAGVSGENYGPDLRFDFLTVRGFVPKQYIDGLATPVSTTIQAIGLDLYAFETLDILKGPASVLYGSAPPGGIYNQTIRRAEEERSGELWLQYGTDAYSQLATTVTGDLSDRVNGRFTLMVRDQEAERNEVSAKRVLLAPTLNFEISDSMELDALFYFQDDEVRGDTNGFLPVFGTLLPNPVGEVSRSVNLGEPDFNQYNRDQFGVGFDLSHQINVVWNLDINSRYSEYSEDRDVIFGTGLLDDNRTVTRGNSPYAEDVESIALDTRLSGAFDGDSASHKLLVGVDYRDVDNASGFGFVGASSIDLFNPVYGQGGDVSPGVTTRFNEQTVEQIGLYAQDQITVGQWVFLISGRYDWVDSEYIQPFTPIGDTGPVLDKQQEQFTFRVGANYLFDNGFAPYISYATSFEPVLGGDIDGNAFDPTTGNQIEAGIKYDGRGLGEGVDLFGSFAVFQITQEDLVSTGFNPNLPVFGVQLGEVEVVGVELEFVIRINDTLSFNGSYSYTDSEITKSNVDVEVGEPLPVTPEQKISLLADYTFQDGQFRGLGFNLGVRYTSESAGSLPGAFNPVVFDSDDSFLVDAAIRYDTDKWRFSINGSNVLDEKYVARCASVSNCNFGAGRQVIGTVMRKF